MDDKTEELRDIFVDVTDEETVTERQRDERGSLADPDEDAVVERVTAVIERMRDRYEFTTDLPVADLQRIVRGFYDSDDDAAIAAALDRDEDTVFRARMDLHLLGGDDTDFPFELSELRDARDDGDDPTDLADALDADAATVERALSVAETEAEIRRVSGRFRSEFEDAIPDAALSVHLTEAAREDGLQEAAEDIETDTQF